MNIIEHSSDFLGGRQSNFSGNNGASWWCILVEKQAHNEQKPIVSLSFTYTFV